MNKDNQSICEINLLETKRWISNNQYHREDGPAVEYSNEDKWWYLHGQLHRLDGPAIEYAGDKKNLVLS